MVFVGAGIVMAENIPDLLVALAGKSSDDALDAKTIGTLLQHADSATGPYIAWNYILVGMMGLCGTIGIGVRQGKRTR